MKRLLKFLAILGGGLIILGICALVVLSQMSCCAIQPGFSLDTATTQPDGTMVLQFDTNIDDVPEFQIVDATGNRVTSVPTSFEREGRRWYWQITVPADTRKVRFPMDRVPLSTEVTSHVDDWKATDPALVIEFIYQPE
jgi:hypothetical protein